MFLDHCARCVSTANIGEGESRRLRAPFYGKRLLYPHCDIIGPPLHIRIRNGGSVVDILMRARGYYRFIFYRQAYISSLLRSSTIATHCSIILPLHKCLSNGFRPFHPFFSSRCASGILDRMSSLRHQILPASTKCVIEVMSLCGGLSEGHPPQQPS